VWGLGVEGRANVAKLRALGVEPVMVDDAPPPGGLDGRPVLATAAGGIEALARCDAVVKTPGLSRYRPDVEALAAGGTPVVGGLGLWLAEADRARVLCVTGTKGKSTTTAIAGHLLARLGHRVVTGGNLGVPPYAPGAPTDADWWVVEVSSYQATDVATSPPVVAVTSLHPDHLPWHRGDAETYYADKLSLCSQPGADLTVANGDSPLLRERRALLGPRVEWVTAPEGGEAPPWSAPEGGQTPAWSAPLGLLGRHNDRNARIARAALAALGVPEAADDDALAAAAAGFRPLESRLCPVATVDGVLCVDDGLSTNVLPTLAAVDAFPGRRVAVLVGGQDRGIDYTPLAAGLGSRDAPTAAVVLASEAAARLHAALDGGPTVIDGGDLPDAVRAAIAWARPDGVVLLSPAAPSFDRYRDYRDRSAAFAAAVRSLLRE
jgi:UDP-N-acetylmuramoyl-L-alanine---L-glutamate ligase